MSEQAADFIALEQHVAAFVQREAPNVKHLAVAVSGGADSMALLHALLPTAHQHHITLHVLTVDHGLRHASAHEARQVSDWVHAITHTPKLHCTILTDPNPLPSGNTQEQARELRYRLMEAYCLKHHITHLCVAHHADDQAETLLLRLERGSGVDGLAAMAPARPHGSITLLRPLLATQAALLRHYLRHKNQAWIEDPSNQNEAYHRNRLRNLLTSLGRSEASLLTERMAVTAKHMARARTALEHYTHQAIAACTQQENPSTTKLALTPWAKLPEEIRLRVLARLLEQIGQQSHPPRFAKLQRLEQMLHAHTQKTPPLAATWHYLFYGCTLKLETLDKEEYLTITAC